MNIKCLPIRIVLALGFTTLLPKAQAVSPAPDGCYPNFTTAEGCNVLQSLTAGAGNTGLGWRSLFSDSTGNFNTGVGAGALILNNADSNTAVGAAALLLNTSGTQNTAVGTAALVNDTGSFNTASGAFALVNNTTGFLNTAMGNEALLNNTIGQENTAVGWEALLNNTAGGFNTAIGLQALQNNVSGGENIALGFLAGFNVTTANGVTCISDGGANVDNTTWIGGIYGVTTQSGVTLPVVVSQDRQLGTMSSSRRFKKEIRPMDDASQSILDLKPVTFHYKADETNTPQFGLVAEEVAEANPDLVVRDKSGDIYTVRYDAVNAMLLNEFLKEHKAFLEETRKVQRLEAALTAVNERLKAQDAKIEKVSAAIVTNTTAPQMARVP